ncbi:MAG: hypothetical protein WCP45_00360 [Verrucomicrobiota bacterium]
MRLKLTIAYDGRPYNGWQSQPCSNTVQDHLHAALHQIAKHPLPSKAPDAPIPGCMR